MISLRNMYAFCYCDDCVARDPRRLPFRRRAMNPKRAPQRVCKACGCRYERHDDECPECGARP